MKIKTLTLVFCIALAAPNLMAQDVGAIRWDAWVGDMAAPGHETEESMGPSEFHWKAPYYSKILGDHHIQVRAITQEIIDQEIQYAAEAGIDYFAYVYYSDALATARKLHLSSERREDVKFCIIIETSRFSSSVVSLLAYDYFKKSFYKTVKIDGIDRPVLFLFSCDEKTASLVSSLRAACSASGVSDPYIVTMRSNSCDETDCDASSNYAISGSDGCSYSTLASKAVDTWEQHKIAGDKVIPLVTAGWDPQPRMRNRNPISWWDPQTNNWAEPGTAAEIADLLQEGINWVNSNPSSAEANAILIYAWNENSEGGWICPTLGEGDARLEAIAQVLGAGPVSGPEPISIPDPAPLPEPGPGGFLENPGFESGDYQSGTDSWNESECILQKVWKTFTYSGEQAIKVMNRSSKASSPRQDITQDLLENGRGSYHATAMARLRKGSDGGSICIETTDDAGSNRFHTEYSRVSEVYSKIGGSLDIQWTGTLKSARIFICMESNQTTDLFLDEFYCEKNE